MESGTFGNILSDCTLPEGKFHNIYSCVGKIKQMKYNSKEIWRQNIGPECFLSFVSLWTPLTQFSCIPQVLLLWASQWLGQCCQSYASQPMARGLRHQVEESSRLCIKRSLTVSTGTQELKIAQCKRARIARGYA